MLYIYIEFNNKKLATMKTVMKRSVIFLNSEELNYEMLIELNLIIQCATMAVSMGSLEDRLNNIRKGFKYFNIYLNKGESHVFQRKNNNIFEDGVKIDDTQLIMYIKLF